VIRPTIENGGSDIMYYEIYMDIIQAIPNFTKVAEYNGLSLTYTIDSSIQTSIVTGTTYRFVSLAVNEFGSSEYSEEVHAALGAKPAKPGQVMKIEELSS
jgi:hypothetical protein